MSVLKIPRGVVPRDVVPRAVVPRDTVTPYGYERVNCCWDRCYDFLNIFAKKFGKKLAFLTQNKAELCKILNITLVFEKKLHFLPKIVKNLRKL
jgi:hypothetical protein